MERRQLTPEEWTDRHVADGGSSALGRSGQLMPHFAYEHINVEGFADEVIEPRLGQIEGREVRAEPYYRHIVPCSERLGPLDDFQSCFQVIVVVSVYVEQNKRRVEMRRPLHSILRVSRGDHLDTELVLQEQLDKASYSAVLLDQQDDTVIFHYFSLTAASERWSRAAQVGDNDTSAPATYGRCAVRLRQRIIPHPTVGGSGKLTNHHKPR